jgi:hypothetical protein
LGVIVGLCLSDPGFIDAHLGLAGADSRLVGQGYLDGTRKGELLAFGYGLRESQTRDEERKQ